MSLETLYINDTLVLDRTFSKLSHVVKKEAPLGFKRIAKRVCEKFLDADIGKSLKQFRGNRAVVSGNRAVVISGTKDFDGRLQEHGRNVECLKSATVNVVEHTIDGIEHDDFNTMVSFYEGNRGLLASQQKV